MGTQGNFQQLGRFVMRISRELLNNQDLCKLLYVTNSNPLAASDIVDTKTKLLGKNIQVKPVIPKPEYEGCFVNIVVDNFFTSPTNRDFLTLSVRFDVLCPEELWEIEDPQLRPFAIMEEIDKYMRHSQKSTIGTMESKTGSQISISDKLAGYSLFYTGVEFK